MNNESNLINIFSITKPLNILYVEDNEIIRLQGAKLFSNFFKSIEIAVDGKDGLDKYNDFIINTNTYYDLIICDIKMPIMDGIEMCKEIYKVNKNQKIIVISAHDDKENLIEFIKIGIEDFIQKPLTFERLHTVLNDFTQDFKNSNIYKLENNCSYNIITKEFLHDENIIKLTHNEEVFIELLIKNNKSPLSLFEIFNNIYYDRPDKVFSSDCVKSLVKRLRKNFQMV